MANEYATADEVKYALELHGSEHADNDITRALTAASRAIDNLCGRRFYADTDANQVRYFTPASGSYVQIDDLITLTSVTVAPYGRTYDDTWVVDTDFMLEPLNAAADGRPYEAIRWRSTSRYYGWPYRYPRSVKVTGKFGWNTTPPEIKEATIMLASQLLKRVREAPFGIVGFGVDVGSAVRIGRFDPHITGLTGQYVRHRSVLIA